jgi:hypothetical protein
MVACGDVSQPCWCSQARIDREVLARIPEPMRRKACICPTCAGVQALSDAAD